MWDRKGNLVRKTLRVAWSVSQLAATFLRKSLPHLTSLACMCVQVATITQELLMRVKVKVETGVFDAQGRPIKAKL